jgi:hypothetical protein
MMLSDICLASWIVVSFSAVFVLFPARLFSPNRDRLWIVWIASSWVRMAFGATLAVFILAKLKVLTTLTLIFLFILGAAMAWLRNCGWGLDNAVVHLEKKVLHFVTSAESRWSSLRRTLQRRELKPRRKPTRRLSGFSQWVETVLNNKLKTASFVAVVVLMGVLQWGRVLQELRFVGPDQYIVLMRARELMLNLNASARPVVFPAIVTVTSLVSGADPLQVTRFLSPVMVLSVVFCLGFFVHRCTRLGAASVIVMYCVGVAAFPQPLEEPSAAASSIQKLYAALHGGGPVSAPPTIEFELGLVFLLLGLVFLADWYSNSRWTSLFDLAFCMVLVGLTSEFLLLLLLTLFVLLLFRPAFVLPAFFLVGTGFAVAAALWASPLTGEAWALIPIAAGAGVGCLIALAARLMGAWDAGRKEIALLAAFMSIAVVCLPPHPALEQPLEYESAARNTRKIAHQFPRQKWLLVAPVEQLPETLGLGAYYDLGYFVEQYRDRVEAPDFTFSENMEDLFIYVEKTPFQVFSQEPSSVSFSVLTDTTYRNYRSPAGRASLESAALQLCENYRKHHSNADIYFEDENLRIYHVHQPVMPNKMQNKKNEKT